MKRIAFFTTLLLAPILSFSQEKTKKEESLWFRDVEEGRIFYDSTANQITIDELYYYQFYKNIENDTLINELAQLGILQKVDASEGIWCDDFHRTNEDSTITDELIHIEILQKVETSEGIWCDDFYKTNEDNSVVDELLQRGILQRVNASEGIWCDDF